MTAQQSWAAQLAVAMAAVGPPLSLDSPAPVSVKDVEAHGMAYQLQQMMAAARQPGASRFKFYVGSVRHGLLVPGSLLQRQQYLDVMRRRQSRQALAQLRTRSH